MATDSELFYLRVQDKYLYYDGVINALKDTAEEATTFVWCSRSSLKNGPHIFTSDMNNMWEMHVNINENGELWAREKQLHYFMGDNDVWGEKIIYTNTTTDNMCPIYREFVLPSKPLLK
jgi:hypothetical protein